MPGIGIGLSSDFGAGLAMGQRIVATAPDVWMKLEDASGTVATDSSGNGVHGTWWRGANVAWDVSNWTFGSGVGLEGEDLPLFGDYDDGTVTDEHFVNLLVGNGFDQAADWDEFSTMIWFKVRAASVWTDGLNHYPWYFVSADGPSGINRHYLGFKSSVDNRMTFRSHLNGNSVLVNHDGIDTTGWVQIIRTISRSADEFKVFLNNVQVGATESVPDDWTEAALSLALVGAASSSGSLVWDGYLQHFCLWDRIITASERLLLQPYAALYDPSA